MESFVLNLFSDQLSKVILDFHEVDINANLLSGKGSIQNIKLNVNVLNELLRTTVPFLEFTEITLTELRVEVTSYTNLKKAPIVLVIDEIYAKAREPLEYYVVGGDNASSNKPLPNNITAKRNPHQKQTPTPPTQPYGLLHRIIDNLSLKINHIHLSFSSLGKFKTRTLGPWTPPTLQVTFDNVEWICVTETGMGGTPEAVWAHNELSTQQSRWRQQNQNQRSRHRSYVIYKKLSMMCHVKLVTGEGGKIMDGSVPKKKNEWPSFKKKDNSSPSKSSSSSSTAGSAAAASSSTLLSNTRVDVYLAYVRRLRDAAVTGADVDVTVHNVDIIVDVASYKRSSGGANGSGSTTTTLTDNSSDVCDLGAFVHMLLGLLHCYYKDRSFADPFVAATLKKMEDGNGTLSQGFGRSSSKKEEEKEDEPETGPDDFLPTVAIMDDDLDSSDEERDYEKEEEEEERREAASAADSGSSMGGEQEGVAASKEEGGKVPVSLSEGASEAADEKAVPNSDAKEGDEGGGDDATAKKYERKRKAVVVLASGAQKFEKLSFSFSMPRLNMKLCLPSDDEVEGSSEDKEEETHQQPTEKHDHCLELLLEGLVAECIWPKNSAGEMGGHVQGSIQYFHVLNSVFHKGWGGNSGGGGGASGPKPWNVAKIYPLCRVGKRLFRGHDAFSLASKLNPFAGEDKKDNFTKCDEFPLMEPRRLSWTWNRSFHGPRAFAFKSTISFVDEALTKWSRTNVVHEASLGEVEVVFNSVPLGRLANLFTEDNVWLDKRWLSGHWLKELPNNITTVAEFRLKDYLQPLPSFTPTGSKSSPLSSELRSITVHFDSISVRLPNPLLDLSTFRCADVIFGISEATIMVNSDLPSSFLAGTVAAEGNPSKFPHDPSDISCGADLDKSAGDTKFRMQISLSDCSLAFVPIQAYALDRGERRFTYLLSPTKVTLMLSLSHSDNNSTAITSTATNLSDNLISHSVMVSVLVHQLDANIEVRSIYGAFETLHYHASNITRFSSDGPALSLSASASKEKDVNPSRSFLVVCIHVPESEVIIWGEQSAAISLQHHKLCHVKVSQLEFGMESRTHLLPQEKQTTAAVVKCSIPSFGVNICSRGSDDGELKMVELLFMGPQSTGSSRHLVEKVHAFCSSSNDAVEERVSKAGFVVRSENASNAGSASTNCNSVEINSPLVVDLDIEAIECFLNLFVECLLSPVFISSGRHRDSIQTPLGSALWSTASALFLSPKDESPEEIKSNKGGGSALFRLFLSQMLLLVPSVGDQVSDIFGVDIRRLEVAIGDCQHRDSTGDSDSSCYKEMIQKLCGSDGQSWLQAYRLGGGADSDTFNVLRSKHTVLGLGSSEQAKEDVQFNIIVPESHINWALPEVAGASAPPFDVFAMKDLGLAFMYGSYPLSQLYFKLYKLSPQSKSVESEFSSAATRLHNLVGSYHCKMNVVMGQMNSEVDRLRRTLFFKERERVGALALASSTASGWIRVGEDLSFSHRIFSSATFFRYWMMLDRSLIILYGAPGDTTPAFVIPLRVSSELRTLSLTSSSIVGNHMQQKGFAIVDSEEGYGLFFVTASNADYRMWTHAISSVLKTGTTTPLESKTQETTPAQHEDPFSAFDGATSPSEPLQAPKPNVPAGTLETNGPDIAPAAPNLDCPGPISSFDDSETMVDVDMEEISLGGTEEILDEPSPCTDNPPGAPTTPPPQLSSKNRDQTTDPEPVMRGRLAFAKGKSKIASARFGSALKSAKGGVLAASEMSREGIKQAIKETPRKDEITRRPLGVGQKMAMLKKNAAGALQPSSSSDEIPGNAKQVVGQKMSLLKKNAGTKLTSLSTTVLSSVNELTTAKANDISQPANESQDESTVNRTGRQEIRKKIDESMSTTMRRLKIDEKIAAVKSGVWNDPMVKQLSNVSFSRHSEQPRQQLGIGDKERTTKPIKFDARQTFGSSSELPLKIKSVSSGEALLIDDDLLEKVESLQKLEGSWFVSVDPIKVKENASLNAETISDNAAVPLSNLRSNSSLDDKLEYQISTTNLLSGSNGQPQAAVQRSTSEVLMFHTTISEIIAKSLPQSAEVVAQEAFQHADSSNPILTKLSSFERLRVSGDTLQRLSKNSPSATNCLLIKVFIATLLEIHMPSQAMDATRAFLNIATAQHKGSSVTNLASGLTAVDEAIDNLSQAISSEKHHSSLPYSKAIESELDNCSSTSSLLKVIMDGYTKAMKERDEALASLATTSIISDNKIMQEQLAKSNDVSRMHGSKGRLTRTNSSDEEMLNLCKQLGNEISLRTAAESEINRLNERLEFERKIAQAKEDDLKRSLAQANTSTDSDNINR